jgi:hypothetical protein
MPVFHRQCQYFGARKAAIATSRGNYDSARPLGQQARGRWKATVRIDDDPGWVGSLDAADGQLRIVSASRLDADDHGVDKRPQSVQMCKTCGAIDVMRAPRGSRQAAVKRLADLTDNDEVIDFTST